MVEEVEEVAVVETGVVVEADVVEPSIRLLHRAVEALSFPPDRAGEAEALTEAEVGFAGETAVGFAEGIEVAFEEEIVVVVAVVEAGLSLLRKFTCESLSTKSSPENLLLFRF